MRIAEAHRRLEAGGLEGKLVLYPNLPSRRDRAAPLREPSPLPSGVDPEAGLMC